MVVTPSVPQSVGGHFFSGTGVRPQDPSPSARTGGEEEEEGGEGLPKIPDNIECPAPYPQPRQPSASNFDRAKRVDIGPMLRASRAWGSPAVGAASSPTDGSSNNNGPALSGPPRGPDVQGPQQDAGHGAPENPQGSTAQPTAPSWAPDPRTQKKNRNGRQKKKGRVAKRLGRGQKSANLIAGQLQSWQSQLAGARDALNESRRQLADDAQMMGISYHPRRHDGRPSSGYQRQAPGVIPVPIQQFDPAAGVGFPPGDDGSDNDSDDDEDGDDSDSDSEIMEPPDDFVHWHTTLYLPETTVPNPLVWGLSACSFLASATFVQFPLRWVANQVRKVWTLQDTSSWATARFEDNSWDKMTDLLRRCTVDVLDRVAASSSSLLQTLGIASVEFVPVPDASPRVDPILERASSLSRAYSYFAGSMRYGKTFYHNPFGAVLDLPVHAPKFTRLCRVLWWRYREKAHWALRSTPVKVAVGLGAGLLAAYAAFRIARKVLPKGLPLESEVHWSIDGEIIPVDHPTEDIRPPSMQAVKMRYDNPMVVMARRVVTRPGAGLFPRGFWIRRFFETETRHKVSWTLFCMLMDYSRADPLGEIDKMRQDLTMSARRTYFINASPDLLAHVEYQLNSMEMALEAWLARRQTHQSVFGGFQAPPLPSQ